MQAREKLLNKLTVCEELKLLWFGKCAYVSFLQYQKREREDDEIVVEERSLFRSKVSAAQVCLQERERKIAETF